MLILMQILYFYVTIKNILIKENNMSLFNRVNSNFSVKIKKSGQSGIDDFCYDYH